MHTSRTSETWIGILKKKHYTTVVCTEWLHIFDVYFQMYVMSKRLPRIFSIFAYEMFYHWSTSDTNLVETILKRQEMWLF